MYNYYNAYGGNLLNYEQSMQIYYRGLFHTSLKTGLNAHSLMCIQSSLSLPHLLHINSLEVHAFTYIGVCEESCD